MGEMRNAYKILVGKPEERRPHGRSTHGWEDDIKMSLRETAGNINNRYHPSTRPIYSGVLFTTFPLHVSVVVDHLQVVHKGFY
jgi:hypothetical protein